MDVKNQIHDYPYLRNTAQVAGVSAITISNAITVSTIADDLFYYNGLVSFSPSHSVDCKDVSCEHCKGSEVKVPSYLLDSIVIVFDGCEELQVKSLVSWLNSMSSPYTVTPLACGRGLGKLKDYYFLALPKFSSTFTQYIKGRGIVEKRRFTEKFIQVIRNIVHGILELKDKGFSCKLEGTDVLISIVENAIVAKIWKFKKGNAKETSGEWVSLGHLIKAAAGEQHLVSAEITELCNKLINKGLEGLEVLKQSALLTPRQKFENILSLNLFISVNSSDNFVSLLMRSPEKRHAVTELMSFMQDQTNWCSKIPTWISNVPEHNVRSDSSGKEFISWLRYIIEHEFLYVPQIHETPATIKKFGKDPDLEACIRALMEHVFLQAQNLAADLGLKY